MALVTQTVKSSRVSNDKDIFMSIFSANVLGIVAAL